MLELSEEALLNVLDRHEGVGLMSLGKPRDGFRLSRPIAHWTSGAGSKYEMLHTNIPAGVMVAAGGLDALDFNDFTKLKEQLAVLDIYPTGKSGDFSGQKVEDLQKWFFDRSRRDDIANGQEAIAGVKKLTPQGLGEEKYNELVDYLADNMRLFKDMPNGGVMKPGDIDERKILVKGLLDDISQTVRYTRLDAPAVGYHLVTEGDIKRQDGSADIHFTLVEPDKELVVRVEKDGKKHITPLDRIMIGPSPEGATTKGQPAQTYVTTNGEPLGERGDIDIGEVLAEMYLADRAKNAPRPSYLKDIVSSGAGGREGSGPGLN